MSDLEQESWSGFGSECEPAWWRAGGTHADDATTRAVALIVHGLNFRPGRMADVADVLAERGVACLLLALQGHGESSSEGAGCHDENARRLESFRRVSRAGWLAQAKRAYALARERALSLGRPLLLVGYSLGALVGLDLLCQPHSNARFEAMVLFAPALCPRWQAHALRCVSMFPRLLIPSFAVAEFAANSATPVAAYNALFASVASLRASPMTAANVPALVFIDRKDELVSPTALAALRERKRLDRWQIRLLERRLRRGERDYHHLIVSAAHLGNESWQRVAAEISDFLAGLPGGARSM